MDIESDRDDDSRIGLDQRNRLTSTSPRSTLIVSEEEEKNEVDESLSFVHPKIRLIHHRSC